MAQLATPSLRYSLTVQRRVIHALLMREIITRFGRENLGVLWLIGEPMLFTLGIVTLWTLSGMRHGNSVVSVASFAITGYSSVLLWRNAANRSVGVVEQNRALLYHRTVRVLDTLATRIIVELLGATGSFIILVTIFGFFGWVPWPVDTLDVIKGWMLLAWFGAAVALIVGAGGTISPIVERLWHPMTYLMFPLSGAAFMVDWLPHKLQAVVLYFPMVHGIELLRSGYFGSAVRPHYDLTYMVACCLSMTLVGLYLVHHAARRLEF